MASSSCVAGVPHSALEDVSLLGYDIPRDTMIISNLYSVHFDPDLWPDPYKFDPTRFLDKEGKLHRPETLIPFSMGESGHIHLILYSYFLLYTILMLFLTHTYSSKYTSTTLEITTLYYSFIAELKKDFKCIFVI